MKTKDMTTEQLVKHYEHALRQIAEMSDAQAADGNPQQYATAALADSDDTDWLDEKVLGNA